MLPGYLVLKSQQVYLHDCFLGGFGGALLRLWWFGAVYEVVGICVVGGRTMEERQSC